MTRITDTSAVALLACEEGFDPIEERPRANIRGTIEAVFNEELVQRRTGSTKNRTYVLAVCATVERPGR